jgi:hypothetical protein
MDSSALLAAEGTTVYKSKDASGNAVFTDRGSEAAEKIKVEDPITFPAQVFEEEKPFDYQNMQSEDEQPPTATYSKLFISSPVDQQVIRDNAGNLTVEGIFPARIAPDHQVRLLMDGSVKAVFSGPTLALTNIDRGTHTLQLDIVDKNSGNVLISSPSISFTIMRYALPRPSPR